MPPARLSAGRISRSSLSRAFGAASLAWASLAASGPLHAASLQTSGDDWQPFVQRIDELQSAPIDKQSDEVLQIDSSGQLAELMDESDFSLQAVRESKQDVPRLFVAELPGDLDLRGKDLFVAALLPLVLHVNEAILQDRARLVDLQALVRGGGFLTMADRIWLSNIADHYKVDQMNFADMLERVDVIPPSMALAQAAVESGWGTSALARSQNALFGQLALTSTVSTRQYVHFDRLRDSAQAYADNLNTNAAYSDFRRLRAAARSQGADPSGYDLLGGLNRYSELGQTYVDFVRGVIVDNDLGSFDHARLARYGSGLSAT